MSRWFRHYAGMMRDEKLVRAAVRSKQPVERVVWVWGAILESAAEINDNGRYEFDAGEAAYFLRCDESDLDNVLDSLEHLGRVCAGVVARWGDRQYTSDGAAERQRRYRERNKSRDGDNGRRNGDVQSGASDVTRDVTQTSRNAAVTVQDTDTDTDTVANATGAEAPTDWRDLLWREGPPFIAKNRGLTIPASKSLIGKWLKLVGDDCCTLLGKIREAEQERVIDPVSWIEAVIRPPPKPKSVGEMFRDEARKAGILPDDSPDILNRRLEKIHGDGLASGAGSARLLALPRGG